MGMPLHRIDAMLEVEYNVFTVVAAGAGPGSLDRPYGNGLVAATTGEDGTVAVIVTGLLDGDIHVVAEFWEVSPPPLELDVWQDAAQVDIDWPGGPVRILGADVLPFPELTLAADVPPGRYRLQVAGRNRDEGEARLPEAPVEEYLLQMWPAAGDEARVLKTTSGIAALWMAAFPPAD
ncbi:hypothetical protein [Micromonospora aurantiaca (nom. illeg.)]|uniref:hypothetical protein n=1 Tax=Micromonospora aurantiaca (nom. illeg.) TaxID=47850 RepID=UPI003F49E86C